MVTEHWQVLKAKCRWVKTDGGTVALSDKENEFLPQDSPSSQDNTGKSNKTDLLVNKIIKKSNKTPISTKCIKIKCKDLTYTWNKLKACLKLQAGLVYIAVSVKW